MGDPGRLSLEDRECWSPEEKLRLVWSTEDGLEILLNRDFRLGTVMVTVREAKRARGAGAPQPPCSPVLGLAPAAALAPAGHSALGYVLPSGPHLDGGVLQGGGAQGDLVTTLRKGSPSPKSLPRDRARATAQHLPLRHPHPLTLDPSPGKVWLQKPPGCAVGTGSGQGSRARTFSSSSTTSMWTRPKTDSPLMCVIRSPARSPAS